MRRAGAVAKWKSASGFKPQYHNDDGRDDKKFLPVPVYIFSSMWMWKYFVTVKFMNGLMD